MTRRRRATCDPASAVGDINLRGRALGRLRGVPGLSDGRAVAIPKEELLRVMALPGVCRVAGIGPHTPFRPPARAADPTRGAAA